MLPVRNIVRTLVDRRVAERKARRALRRLARSSTQPRWTGLEELEQRVMLSAFTNASFAGAVAIQGTHNMGSLVLDGNGNIPSGTINSDSGNTKSITGAYNVASTGVLTVTASSGGSIGYNAVGAINSTANLAVLNDTPLPSSDGDGDADLNVVLKHNLTDFADSDVAGTWGLVGPQVHGTVTFDANGNVTGGGGHHRLPQWRNDHRRLIHHRFQRRPGLESQPFRGKLQDLRRYDGRLQGCDGDQSDPIAPNKVMAAARFCWLKNPVLWAGSMMPRRPALGPWAATTLTVR